MRALFIYLTYHVNWRNVKHVHFSLRSVVVAMWLVMDHTIRLKINGTETDLPWSEFVANIDSTVTSIKLFEYFDTAFVVQCSTLLFLMQVRILQMFSPKFRTFIIYVVNLRVDL